MEQTSRRRVLQFLGFMPSLPVCQKGLMGRRGRVPTIVYVWSGLLSIIISLLWVYINPPSGRQGYMNFQFP
ncbi:hypothetical protein L6164_034739 [Bauhinia variegata]|uniref:Uncharacterized protein n=1 Tax=Bauhinia variegata TaxID=167791 RepID=A0ACB9KVV4_BAUVA|nr:hypothetical protein L6164_034739 [Bauhinia variegata]